MHRLFIWLGCLAAAAMAFQIVGGHFVTPGSALFAAHFYVGVATAVYLCALHTIVLFHFIGTGADIKESAVLLGGDVESVRKTRRFKAAVFPLATFAMLAIIAGEMLGGGAHSRAVAPAIHGLVGWGAVLLNLHALRVTHRTLRANAELVADVQARLRDLVTPSYLRGEPR